MVARHCAPCEHRIRTHLPRMIGRMIVAIDVGNTNVTVGIIAGRRRGLGHAAPRRERRRRVDELEMALDELLALDGAALSD